MKLDSEDQRRALLTSIRRAKWEGTEIEGAMELLQVVSLAPIEGRKQAPEPEPDVETPELLKRDEKRVDGGAG